MRRHESMFGAYLLFSTCIILAAKMDIWIIEVIFWNLTFIKRSLFKERK